MGAIHIRELVFRVNLEPDDTREKSSNPNAEAKREATEAENVYAAVEQVINTLEDGSVSGFKSTKR